MGVYAVTGSASGMGRAAAEQLRADGHTVIGVDQRDADVVADLSTPRGRSNAAAAVLDRADGRLDGAVLAAGVGPLPGAENVGLILSVNYFGVTELLDAWRPALAAAKALEQAVPERLLRVELPPMADWLEGFLSMKVHALIRFGRWADVIAEPFPTDPDLYCVTTAMLRYARGVAMAATGDVAGAETERELFHQAVARVPESRTVFNNTCQSILQVASAMLDGELEYRKGNFDEAFAHLRRSVALDDALPYDEPWAWMQPVRHALGALLLEQGRVDEALATYRDDLGLSGTLPRALQHPGNVWSLHGYAECLELLGRSEEAAAAKAALALAKARADVPIEASCFCRLDRSCCE